MTKKIEELANKAGMQPEEAAELFCEETLESMSELSTIAEAAQTECIANGCTNYECVHNGCKDPFEGYDNQKGCSDDKCVNNGCFYTSTPTPTTPTPERGF